MPVYFDKAKKRWRFTFNRIIDGARHRASRLLPAGWSRHQAEAYDRQQGGALYAQATGIEQPPGLIDTAVALWLRHKMPTLRNGKKAAQDLAHIMPWFQGRTFEQLDDIARDYAAANPELAPATVRNRLSYLRAACRYAWKRHKLGDRRLMPGAGMEMPVVDNIRDIQHTRKDLNKLWAEFDDDEARALFQLAFAHGLRWRSELLPRKPEDVVRNGGIWLIVPTTKNKKPRMIPIVPGTEPLLKYLPFERHDRTYYAAFERARARASMDETVAHDLRHVLASTIINGQGTLADVGAALGHTSLQASHRYAHLYPSHLRRILNTAAKRMPTTTSKKQGTKGRKRA